ncbi:MAG: hypothetical protein Alpg2KO_19920 [Alphaproteobacteria bacterium]
MGLIAVVTLTAVTGTGSNVVELFDEVADSTGAVVNGTVGTDNTSGDAAPTPTPDELFSFTSHDCTPCGATGPQGPTLSQCQSAYGTAWSSDTNYFNQSTQGIQEFTIPETGTYRITAWGAQGGDNTGHSCSGGRATRMIGEFDLNVGDVLKIIVGQRG